MKPTSAVLAIALSAMLPSIAEATVLYVDLNSVNPTPPYANWPTAATTIQDAVDASTNGDQVLVTNGIYQSGATMVSGSNRVSIVKAITVASVNGPAVTWIVGYQEPGNIYGTNSIRGVYLTNGATLSGFTLTNGSSSGNGGGALCGQTAVVSNCVFVGNATLSTGAGIYGAMLYDCVLSGNITTNGNGCRAGFSTLVRCLLSGNRAAYGGGSASCSLSNCTASGNTARLSGGGSYLDGLDHCVITHNFATTGGGAYSSYTFPPTLINCLVAYNTATNGGGLYSGDLVNCTVVSNNAVSAGGGIYAGGGAVANNCIVYYNLAPVNPNTANSKFYNTCTTPGVPGTVITNEPAFVNPAAGNFHLQPVSRCINAGANSFVTNSMAINMYDLDGLPRISGGTVDIGAFEFQAQVTNTFNAWLQQHSLPTDGSADYADSDADGMNSWQEWLADTDPASAASVLRLAPPANGLAGVTVTWQSVNSRNYALQRSVNLSSQSAFTTIQSNIVGQAGTTSFTDTNVTGSSPVVYRVGVQ